MPKIIFISKYMKDTPPSHLENYVRYISTREGVEKIDESKRHLSATENQKRLIQQLLCDVPNSKELLEYEDYCWKPTMGNASELISCILEQNIDMVGKKENYVDYIANRPRVERMGQHGLFTDAGQPVVLAKVQEEVIRHKGPVWTHVISLRREDASRLGYDSGEQWRELLRSKRAMLCKYMKIDSENLRWYAAYHNEGHHPHVHLMVYSAKDNDGYLTQKAIEAMRSELAHAIFRQDFANLYEKQNQARAELKEGAEEEFRVRMEALHSGTMASPEIENHIMYLFERLQNIKGKKVYGYLKKDVKNLVDQIVDELAKDSRVDALYQAWGNWQKEIRQTYQKEGAPLPPLSQQPQFKSIKNMVIAEALKLGSQHVTFEEDRRELEESPGQSPVEWQAEENQPDENEVPDQEVRVTWSQEYKLARQCLYGEEAVKQDFAEAFRLFLQEAKSGNALAMHDLGRMYADGLGRERNPGLAREWYTKALRAFHAAERTAKDKQRSYLQYRIGKLYAAGLGTDQDYTKAALWFEKAVEAVHKYAQYSLAGLYFRGQGVGKNLEQAFTLYTSSARQGNPYADYEAAKMYRDGIGTDKEEELAKRHFQKAFAGFRYLEEESHDDKLQYRIGQMLYSGTGTPKDEEQAAVFWEHAAKLGNKDAQVALGKLWLENGTGSTEQAVAWIEKAAEGESASARYMLGKIYLEGTYVPKDIPKAVKLFTQAAEQKNEYAAYQLGRIYLFGEEIPKDTEKAIRWLILSADLGNQYAQYALGKIYLAGEEAPQDIARAVELFTSSANQKNMFAQYQLGKLYLSGEYQRKDVETGIRWLADAADQNNQYAQYVLGKLYLCGHEVPRDKEKAEFFLQASAAQGNCYARFFLDHMDSFRDPSAFLAATRLLHQLENLFRDNFAKVSGGSQFAIDRKRRRKLTEKKQAQGHKKDDREPLNQQQNY